MRPNEALLALTIALVAAVPPARASWHALDSGAQLMAERILSSLPLPPEVAIVVDLPRQLAKGRGSYVGLVTREAERQGVPPALADAVATIESGYNPAAIGKVGEIGLMQVRPGTAAMLGYKGTLNGLADAETNIRYGVRYLAQAWRLAGGNLCRALTKYRSGHGEERFTPLSIDYCRRARAHLASVGSPLAAAALPIPSVPASKPGAVQLASAGPVTPTRLLPAMTTESTARATRQAELLRKFVQAMAGVGGSSVPPSTMRPGRDPAR